MFSSLLPSYSNANTTYLAYWLLFLGALRCLNVIVGYTNPNKYKDVLFSRAKDQVTGLQARSFAVWTALTCVLCIICAYNMHERGIYLATLISFYTAFTFFTIEFILYQTMLIKNILAVAFFASSSALWMTIHGIPK
jgi:hypothetical protein